MNKQASTTAFVVCLVSVSTAVLLAKAPAARPASGDLWPTRGWGTATPASVGLDEQGLNLLDKDFAEGKFLLVDSFLVFRCGKKAYESTYAHDYVKIYGKEAKEKGPLNQRQSGPYNYFDPYWHPYYHGTDMHSMQSVTKTVTSIIVGVAKTRGDFKAGLDTPVLKYFDVARVKNVDDRKRRMTLTAEKIEHIARVDRGERFAPAFSAQEMIERVTNEMAYLRQIMPAAVVTGSYLTIPVTCRMLKIPLVWVIQSTWLEPFFSTGAGMTDGIRPRFFRWLADFGVLGFINFWIRYGFLNPVNRAAKHFGVEGYKSIFDFWRGDITLVAEPPEFSGLKLPPDYHYVGPLIAREDFPLPQEVTSIPRDMPLIYFAMGSSGTPEIVANILQGFDGKPYRVIAPIKFQLQRLGVIKIPSNVIVTDWLPALEVNRMADLSLIHGGIGTVMTACYAGKPVVGVGMQPEQVANLACLVRKGFAIRVPKSLNPSPKVQEAIRVLLRDDQARRKAEDFAQIMAQWDGSRASAELLFQRFGQ